MTEREVEAAWRQKGKGRGLRWHIQREMVALLSRKASTTTQVQRVMTLRRGLSHRKTVELLEELKAAEAIVQEFDKEIGYFWFARQTGVSVFLGNMKAIPVRVAEELFYRESVNESEE